MRKKKQKIIIHTLKPIGFFEKYFREMGKLLDVCIPPMMDLLEYTCNIIEQIEPRSIRIRTWLYQKQWYFGWK